MELRLNYRYKVDSEYSHCHLFSYVKKKILKKKQERKKKWWITQICSYILTVSHIGYLYLKRGFSKCEYREITYENNPSKDTHSRHTDFPGRIIPMLRSALLNMQGQP